MTYQDDDRDFTPGERAAIRRFMLGHTVKELDEIKEIVVTHKRVAWLWATVGVWLKWIFWIAAGVVSLKLAFGDYVKGLLR